ncbi:MAG: helix-turn-helix domain-containing protein [Massilioclostridium sp.]|nr:helix-turn-helix domain-containing protein [Massilioclostridium sp.]
MDKLLRNILHEKNSRRITDRDFQKDLGLYSSAVSEWKNGKSKSYQKHLAKIANYFGVSTDYLLGNEQKNKPTVDDDELTEMLSDPRLKSIYEKLLKLTPENLDLADSQLDAILSHQDKSQK